MRPLLLATLTVILFTNGFISACTYVPPTAAESSTATSSSGQGGGSTTSTGEGGAGGAGGEAGMGVGGLGGSAGTGGGGGSSDVFLDWVNIPGGAFEMGSTVTAKEQPVHQVNVPGFELTRTEITVAQYMQCVANGACLPPFVFNPDCYWSKLGFENYPVNCVNWEYSEAFCAWAGGRLPSEAEWEYAARSGGQVKTYPWGEDPATCDLAVEKSCLVTTPQPVCSKPNGNTVDGLCDMAGNVFEWLQDTWHVDYNGAPDDGSAWEGTPNRIVRGGAYASASMDIRTSSRGVYFGQAYKNLFVGFRCAR